MTDSQLHPSPLLNQSCSVSKNILGDQHHPSDDLWFQQKFSYQQYNQVFQYKPDLGPASELYAGLTHSIREI